MHSRNEHLVSLRNVLAHSDLLDGGVFRIFSDSAGTDDIKDDLEKVTESFTQAVRQPKKLKATRERKETILRDDRIPPSPDASNLLVQSLSSPKSRPKTVRIGRDVDTRLFEGETVRLVNQEEQEGFLSVEGRWGLRFPTPHTSEEDEGTTALFRQSYPQFALRHGKNAVRAPMCSHRTQDDGILQADVQEGIDLMRGRTPSRMGFAGDRVGEMAYNTNLIRGCIRPKQADNRWRREICFTPIEGQRLWEHGMSAHQGLLGPPSRHVQTRAGRVVEEAKERAMKLTSPRRALVVRDAAGTYRTLEGLVTSHADSTPLQLCSPFPGKPTTYLFPRPTTSHFLSNCLTFSLSGRLPFLLDPPPPCFIYPMICLTSFPFGCSSFCESCE